MVRRSILLLLMSLLAACNLSVPDVTPTLAPTRTPSPTPQASSTPLPTVVALVASNTPTSTLTLTPSPTLTNSPAPSPTVTPTNTPSMTPTTSPTASPTPTVTPSDAPTATASFTPQPTATQPPPPTETLLPTVTPLLLLPSETPTPTDTPTLTPSNMPTATVTPTPSNTPRPSPTPTRTLSPEELAQFATQNSNGGITPTEPPVQPNSLPTLPPPTLDVTPTFITAEATINDAGIFTPLPADTTPDGISTTPTPQPTVALIVTLAPLVTAGPPVVPVALVPPPNPQTRAFALSTEGGVVSTGFSLLNDTTLFARNPVDRNLYVTTDSSGNLYLTGLNGAGAYRPDMSPFSQFYALEAEENDSFVSAVAWSPDGRYLAFIVDGDRVAKDGVWIYQQNIADPTQLLVDCSPPDFTGCGIVSNPFDPEQWESRGIAWSPESDALLISLFLPSENRPAVMLLPLNQNYNTRPPVLRYDYGSWGRDGARILVSGRGPDGHVYVGWVNRDGSFSEVVYDAEVIGGLWMGFANQAADGRIYALGAPGDRNGAREPLRLYNMSGQSLTPPIGEGVPERVEWSPDGTAAFVQTGGRQYIANINGEIRDITGQVAGTRAVNWVAGELPPGDSFSIPVDTGAPTIVPIGATAAPPIDPVGATAAPAIPLGVVEGNTAGYQPGQQLRVYVTELNIRTGPGVAYPFSRAFLQPGEYVAILAGPVEADGAVWWQVQTADNVIGWIAGAINGAVTLGP